MLSLLLWLLFQSAVGDSKFDLSSQRWTFSNETSKGVAYVPGDIYSDLYKNNLIYNPYYADHDIKLKWVPRCTWTYSATLKLPPNAINATLMFLEFEGVDGFADIYLDGALLGATNNRFRSYTFNVTSSLKQTSLLELKFSPIVKVANRLFRAYKRKYNVEIPPLCPPEVQNGECHVNFLRKTQSSFSWDWGPSFPTVGIYRPIDLIYFQVFHLHQISPLVIYDNNTFSVLLQISYRCAGLQTNDYNFMIGISELNILSRVDPLKSCAEGSLLKLEYRLKVANPNLQLWYPRGYGQQKLYRLKVIANYRSRDSWEKQSLHKNVGFRYVELNKELVNHKKPEFGRNFAFSVNSIPIFLKGASFVPKSVFPSNFPRTRLEFLFYSMAEANMNSIRVWGGGDWPDNDFFDLADKYGILVFHDLMFACALYPTNSEFLSNIEEEITENILRIRNHPSILIYSGNNELELGIAGDWWFGVNYKPNKMVEDYVKLMQTAMKAVRSADPTAPLLRSSPSNADFDVDIDYSPNNASYGDIHFYDELNNLWKVDNLMTPRCATEYGVPSFPLHTTMLNYIPLSEWSYTSRLINLRNHHSFGVATLPVMLSQHFSIPRPNGSIDMNNFAYISQIHQAITTRVQSEHYRRYRSFLNEAGLGHTMCALYWQLNDVWAAPTWSSIDFDQRWKALHYHAKQMFEPVIISMYIDKSQSLQLYVVSDLTTNIQNATLRLRMMSLHEGFRPIYEQNYTVSVPALSSVKIDYFSLGHPYDQDFFFKSELYSTEGVRLAKGFLPLEKLYDNALFGKAQLKSLSRLNATLYEIELSATDVVPYVWLDLDFSRLASKGVKMGEMLYHFSDNAFYISEPTTTVNLILYTPMTLDLTLEDLTLCWIYNC